MIRSHSGGNLVCLFFLVERLFGCCACHEHTMCEQYRVNRLVQTGCVPGPGCCVFVCFVKFCICIHHTITTHHRNKFWICFFMVRGRSYGTTTKGICEIWHNNPETNMAPQKSDFPERRLVFQPSMFRVYVMLVLGRES